MTTTIEELKPMFLRLKLAAMYEHAQEMLDDVETSSMSHMDLLKHLFEAEIARRDESALNRRIKQANCRYRDACMSGIDYSIDQVSIKRNSRNLVLAIGYVNIKTASSPAKQVAVKPG